MGKFLIAKAKNGEYRFVLKAGNGEIIATSETYSSISACKSGVESVCKIASCHVEDQTVEGFETLKHPKYELYKDKKGEFRFRLKASNGEIIATGESYTAKSSCKNGIDSIAKNSKDAEIVVAE